MTFSHFDFKYIDAHAHFFPPNIFKAIWNFFEKKDEMGKINGWPINYKLITEELITVIESKNVKAFTTYNYAHKEGVANYINDWTYEFVKNHQNAIPFGCVWPSDKDRGEYVKKLFDNYGFKGIKVQPLVQNFYPFDERLDEVYKVIVDRGKWFTIHAGTAPYRNEFVGFAHFLKFIKKYPEMKVIVPHLGAFEYQEFFGLLGKHENLYLDTTMIFIPDNVFPERKIKRPTPELLLSFQDRILFGSDFPNIPYDYERSTKGLLDLDLPREFYEDIFFNNAKRLFEIH